MTLTGDSLGNILKMMSDPVNRGRIVWVIITARPDRLEPDIKRSGRAGEHLPVFDNEGEEKQTFLKHVLTQAEIDLDAFTPEQHEKFLQLTSPYFPADFDQLLTELKRRRHLEGTLTSRHGARRGSGLHAVGHRSAAGIPGAPRCPGMHVP